MFVVTSNNHDLTHCAVVEILHLVFFLSDFVQSTDSLPCEPISIIPQIALAIRGSYFKLGGEGSQILRIRCRVGGAVTQGVVGGVVWCV